MCISVCVYVSFITTRYEPGIEKERKNSVSSTEIINSSSAISRVRARFFDIINKIQFFE